MKRTKWGITSIGIVPHIRKENRAKKEEMAFIKTKQKYQLVELTKSQFRQFSTIHSQANFQQTVEFSELLEKRGWQRVFFLGIKNEDEQIIGATLVSGMKMKISYYYEICGGMLIDYDKEEVVAKFMYEIKKFVKQHNGSLLTIKPNVVYQQKRSNGSIIRKPNQGLHNLLQSLKLTHEGFTQGYCDASPRCIFVKELKEMTSKKLLQSYHSSTRTKINRSIKKGIQIRELSERELPLFKDIMQHTSDRKGFSDKELEYYQILKETFKKEAKFLVAEVNIKMYMKSLFKQLVVNEEKHNQLIADTPKKKNQEQGLKEERLAIQKRIDEICQLSKSIENSQPLIVAGGLFIETSNEIIYLFGGMYEEYKNFQGASHLLQHHMMTYALERHIPRYNFYGISGVYDGTDGVLNFKRSFGGIVEEHLGSYHCILKPIQYYVYRYLKNKQKTK
ncbi:alanine adding enzyme [Enterococcus sp. DIV0212c]|uniref:peptidoglycan bridge formation glycyltransferase FemA/FemB family protein n=1 Tax=Enterococcus sp. DIV0212c TaxID=2230867 RepID=UPI001A9BEFCD|nr:peptidoglycan bridge formation glycyltransferase FemA/FemB family protein [Enterococcus sp. DIV0212c]MBO1355280.1 peptidoglycan bridge formation glycyltransferase FemA/FemB family protein [Enterococcus sp. DIV0212c]